jgi:hypothetical protein
MPARYRSRRWITIHVEIYHNFTGANNDARISLD